MSDSRGNRWLGSGTPRGPAYDRKFTEMEESGADVHGEATFVASLGARSVLDAGCGTGRVAIELARRGTAVMGVDVDPVMLDAARAKAPELSWVHADLAHLDLVGRRFDVVVLAGNVMIFLAPGTEASVVMQMALHLEAGGALVAGFQLLPGRLGWSDYDQAAVAAGLALEERWATWDRAPWYDGCGYAVSVHRLVRPPSS